MPDEQVYFNIIKMSEAFREWSSSVTDPDLTSPSFAQMIRLWETRAVFAMAQQLSIISVSLKEIAQSAKVSNNRVE